MKKYSVNHFIKKFTKIPKHRWTVGSLLDWPDKDDKHQDAQMCVLGHCGLREEIDEEKMLVKAPEAYALSVLFRTHFKLLPWQVNDMGKESNLARHNFAGKHPRTRVLNALKKIASMK